MKNIVILILSILAIIVGIFIPNEIISEILKIVGGIFLGFPLTALFNIATYDKRRFSIFINTRILHRNDKIRISFSYLFRIMIKGKYLLIKGNHFNKYQPVGGVYKYYECAKSFLTRIGYEFDDKICTERDINDDLRIYIPARNVLKFYDWFNTMEDREYDPRREFNEELIESQIISKSIYDKLKYKKVKTFFNGIKYSKHHQCYELLVSDIFETVLDKDDEELIYNSKNDKFILVSSKEIEKRVLDNQKEESISNNAIWLLGEEK